MQSLNMLYVLGFIIVFWLREEIDFNFPHFKHNFHVFSCCFLV